MRNFIKKLKTLKQGVELGEKRKDFIRENLIAMIRKEDNILQAKEIIRMRKTLHGEPTKIRKGDDASKTGEIVSKRRSSVKAPARKK